MHATTKWYMFGPQGHSCLIFFWWATKLPQLGNMLMLEILQPNLRHSGDPCRPFRAISVSSIIVMSGLVTSIRWQCISCMLAKWYMFGPQGHRCLIMIHFVMSYQVTSTWKHVDAWYSATIYVAVSVSSQMATSVFDCETCWTYILLT